MELKQGTLLQNGKYKIEKVLGQGNLGITYVAEQTRLERKVAIKEFFMKEYCNRDEDTLQVSVPSVGSKELVSKFKQKFVKEAENMASLVHSHIVRIYDVFEENNTAYYVMEYSDCGSLSDYLSRRGRLPEEEAIAFIRQIANALLYIHKKRVNHLDIKPGNILLDEKNNAVLIDFGFSRHYDSDCHQTSSTLLGISKGYAPIEQYKQGGVSQFSPETDIYSLGATLYKLVTGETPPEVDDIYENGLNFPNDVSLSANVKSAIVSAMQPRRKDRPKSIRKFLSILDSNKLVSNEDVEIMDIDDAKQKVRRNKMWKVLSFIIALIVGIGGYFVVDNIQEKKSYGSIGGHEWVDLGLSVKWATCNVGAYRPEDFGYYFAWGEVVEKTSYTEGNSKTYGNSSYGDIGGDSGLDAARVNWGDSWRLPTKAECEELVDKCTWKWITQNGVKGFKVTASNGNSIFLPAAGYNIGSSLSNAGERGYYWSSAPYGSNSSRAYGFLFRSEYYGVNWGSRRFGRSVRPVSE